MAIPKGTDAVNYYRYSQYDFSRLRYVQQQRRKKGQTNRNFKTERYADVVCGFDIETTRIPEIDQSVMYVWQFGIDYGEHIDVIVGRTWDEFAGLLIDIDCNVKPKMTVMIYVWNLSYEFQYLRAIYDFQKDEVFAIKSRKVLRCTMYSKRFEFRCAYLLTNMSLDQATKKYKVEHGKLSGVEFDYNKPRYPWTLLSWRELHYCVNDIVGMLEVLRVVLGSDDDNFYSVPYTSTGYVRRDVKKATAAYHKLMHEMGPDLELYKALRAAFRGGNTHANRYYVDRVVTGVHSVDRSSSYPDVLCNCEFPMDYFTHLGAVDNDYFYRLLRDRHKAMLIRVKLSNVHLTSSYWGCPYIPKAKCITSRGILNDNGRVLLADFVELWLTDVDFHIIEEEYTFALEVLDVYFCRYAKLPKPYVKVIEDYYKAKTELKGVPGQEVYYMKSKNKLNSIYGMMATDPVRDTCSFNGLDFELDEEQDVETDLLKANRKSFCAYAWGVWCTAWARYELEKGIKAAGRGFVYCDTDSVKYVGVSDFSEINREMIERSIENEAFATDPHGVTHYMGVYEDETGESGLPYFKTMGAKKYAYIDEKNKLHITIAGVNKHIGVDELLKYADGDPLKALQECFVDGFTFSDAGGLEAVYNDKPEITWTVEGRNIEITPNTCLKPSTYTCGKTGEYQAILRMGKVDFERLVKKFYETLSE